MKKVSKIFLSLAVVSLGGFAIARSLLGGWMPFYTILLGFTALFLGVALISDRRLMMDFLTTKTTKHGMNMGAMMVLALSLVVILNYIGLKRNKSWDLSQSQANTLSDQSVQILKNLKSELKITYFYKDGTQGIEENRRAFRELLKKYQDQSHFVQLEFYEVNQNPKLAEDYGVNKGSGLAFAEYEGRRNRIERVEEQEITQVIIKVTRKKLKTLYFTIGHGEADPEDSQDAGGLNAYKMLIENNSFLVKSWNLATQPQVPSDADAVFVVGPQQKFADYEIKVLENYLKEGGSLLLGLEPGKTQGLEILLKKMGIVPEVNFIKSSYMGIGFIDGGTIGNVFSLNSGVTKAFANERDIVRFLWPMNLRTEKVPSEIKIEPIVRTDENAFAFLSPKVETGNMKDLKKGPFQLGLEVKGLFLGGTQEFQMIVFGDAEFMTNQMLYQNLNRDLAMNSASQLAREEGLVSISPREAGRTELLITTAKLGGFYLFLFLLPLSSLVVSILLWMKRRGGK